MALDYIPMLRVIAQAEENNFRAEEENMRMDMDEGSLAGGTSVGGTGKRRSRRNQKAARDREHYFDAISLKTATEMDGLAVAKGFLELGF